MQRLVARFEDWTTMRSASQRRGFAVWSARHGSGSLSSAGETANGGPGAAEAKLLCTGTGVSRSRSLRWRAARTATFMVLAARCGTSGFREVTGTAPGRPTWTERVS